MTRHSVSVSINGKEITFETGLIAKQAGGAATVKCGDTMVFSATCRCECNNFEQTFIPLRVDYQEKFSAVGKTVGGFLKREGRASEKEILISRLIDRPLRPMFADWFYDDVQVSSFVWSYDKENSPDVLAICCSSAALMISDIPLKESVAAVRVIVSHNGGFVVNPHAKMCDKAKLNCVIAGTKTKILMIEGHADFASQSDLKRALDIAQEHIAQICKCIDDLAKAVGTPKADIRFRPSQEDITKVISFVEDRCISAMSITDKQKREHTIKQILQDVYACNDFEHLHRGTLHNIVNTRICDAICSHSANTSKRTDGRSFTQVRDISIEPSFLPRSHGSVLFTRGQTQSLAVCTLGSDSMSQKFETLDGEGSQRFYLQYSFPGFSSGEASKLSAPGRRELGHGKLAEKSLDPIIPSKDRFPYSIRIESTITESNGSSSMASVCGGCLALMDAGVPISNMVAGIAMGLLGDDNGTEIILSDISGTEDAFGKVDFKLSGNNHGITGLQMDMKVDGLSIDTIDRIVTQSMSGLEHILSVMNSTYSKPKKHISSYAPKIALVKITAAKIPVIIGPNGRTIKHICEKTGVELNIDQSSYCVHILANSDDSLQEAKNMIEELISDICIGKIYEGTIKSVVAFGVFVEITPGKEGLCHVSELIKRVPHGQPIPMKTGEHIRVRVLDVNEKGQIKLTQRT